MDCIHIETQRRGKIIDILPASDKFPRQFGIFWYGSYDGILNYWQDCDKVVICNANLNKISTKNYGEDGIGLSNKKIWDIL